MNAESPNDLPYRCPVSCCAGFVSLVDDEDDDSFWGCGECGAIWYEKQKLMDEITAIIKQFDYRLACYEQSNGGWVPASLDNEPDEYEDLVYEEPKDESEDCVRG